MPTKTVNISFPQKVLDEIDAFAQKESLSRSDVLRIGAQKYIQSCSDWKAVQKLVTKKAKKLGLKTEEDIVKYIQ